MLGGYTSSLSARRARVPTVVGALRAALAKRGGEQPEVIFSSGARVDTLADASVEQEAHAATLRDEAVAVARAGPGVAALGVCGAAAGDPVQTATRPGKVAASPCP